jgi:putative tryptophan/tyrosine transport system substrate-binding protein
MEVRAHQAPKLEGCSSRRLDTARGWRGRRVRVVLPLILFFSFVSLASARVVVLVDRGASIYQQAAEGFRQGFAGADQVEQLDLSSDNRTLNAAYDSLRRSPPRLVIAIGTAAAQAAREHLPDVPILYCLALRPVENKLVGANIGGVALDIEFSQQVSSLQRALPNVRRIGVVYEALTSGPWVRQAQKLLPGNVTLVARDARTPREAAREIEDLLSNVLGRDDAFLLLWDPVTANAANFKLLVDLSLKYKVPLIAPARPFVEAGALMSIGADYLAAGRQTGRMAQQVLLQEARPEDFAAVPAPNPVITINGEVARHLGITFPRDLRAEILSAP